MRYQKSAFYILGIIIFFYLVNNFIWLKENIYPNGPDEYWHLLRGLKFSKAIFSNAQEFLYLSTEPASHWPPFFHFSSAIVTFFLGTSYISLIMTNIVYLTVLLFSIYFIGLKLFDNITGLLAAMVISMYPMIFIYSRFFNPDFALAAMTCLSVCFLIYADYFRNRKFSLLFGLSFGLGMLTKTTFILFLTGPLIYILYQMFLLRKSEAISLKKISLHFIISISLGILIASLWYWPAFSNVTQRTKAFLWSIPNSSYIAVPKLRGDAWFYMHRFLGYFNSLIKEQISFLFFIVFLVSAPLYFRFKNNSRPFLILWFVVPYLILTLSFDQQGRYMIASLPVIALISAAGIQSMNAKKIRMFFWILIFILGLAQFFYISYNTYRKERTLPFQFETGHYYGPPFKKELKVDVIADSIARYCKRPKWPINIVVMCDDDYSNNLYGFPLVIDYSLAKKGIYSGESVNVRGDDLDKLIDFIITAEKFNFFVFISKNSSWPAPDAIFTSSIDYFTLLINRKLYFGKYKFGPSSKIAYDKYAFMEIANQKFKKLLDDNKPIERIALPDGYFAFIYAKKIDSIEKNSLKLFINNNQCRVCYKNIELMDLRVFFNYQNNFYDSSQFSWQVEKINSAKLVAKCTGSSLPFALIWKLEILEDNKIDWQIETETDKEIKLKDIEASLFLSSDYRDWISLFKQGRFLQVHLWTKNRGNAALLLDSNYLGVKGKGPLPSLLFEQGQDNLIEKSFLQNTDYFTGARVLGFRNYQPVVDIKIGRQRLFHGKIDIFDNDKDMYRYKGEINKNAPIISQGPLKLYFKDGSCKLYFQGVEITKQWGLYAVFLSQQNSYGSSTAKWEIDKLTSSQLISRGTWPGLPIICIWRLELLKNNIVNWQIDIEAKEKVQIEAGPYVSLVLSYNYQKWATLNNQGVFLKISPRQKKGWSWLDKPSSSIWIGVRSNKRRDELLPGVVLKIDKGLILDRTVPQNTDYSIRARALDVQRQGDMIEPLKLDRGNHKIFTGQIIIFEKDPEMELFLKQIRDKD